MPGVVAFRPKNIGVPEVNKKTGKTFFRTPRNTKYSEGIPDIVCCYHGRFIAFEVKRDSKVKPSKEQIDFMTDVNALGGKVFVVWSLSQVVDLLTGLSLDEKMDPPSLS